MSIRGIERDTLHNFSVADKPGIKTFTAASDSDVFALFSKPLEEYRISFGARPSATGAVTALDAKLLGSIDGTVFDILLAEVKHTDTASQPTNSAWDSTNGETVQNLKAFVKYIKITVVSITTTGSISFPIWVN